MGNFQENMTTINFKDSKGHGKGMVFPYPYAFVNVNVLMDNVAVYNHMISKQFYGLYYLCQFSSNAPMIKSTEQKLMKTMEHLEKKGEKYKKNAGKSAEEREQRESRYNNKHL